MPVDGKSLYVGHKVIVHWMNKRYEATLVAYQGNKTWRVAINGVKGTPRYTESEMESL